MIAECFEDLAQSFRIYSEVYIGHRELMAVDRAEACSNLDNGFTNLLNGLHSLYDADTNGANPSGLDWYGIPSLAVAIAVRNARHHNQSQKIRSLYTFHARTKKDPTESHRYLLLDFKDTEPGAQHIDYFISWADFSSFLQSNTNRLRTSTIKQIRDYLHADQFEEYCKNWRFETQDLFINAIPIVLNACIAMLPSIRPLIRQDLSIESDFFSNHFSTLQPLDTSQHELCALDLHLPN